MSDRFRDAVNVEHRGDDPTRHGGITTYVLPNGTRAATTSAALSAVFGRYVVEQHREGTING